MAYNISLTNGEPLVTIADNTVDVNYTSLSLIGKNYSGYGQVLNENFVHLLENFSNSSVKISKGTYLKISINGVSTATLISLI